MQRRSFVKKSVSAAVLTPLAFSGLINAAGAVDGETATTWFGMTDPATTVGISTTSQTTDPPPLFDPEVEFPSGACPCAFVGWWWAIDMIEGMPTRICWREVAGCELDGVPVPTTNYIVVCPTVGPDDIARDLWCNGLQHKPKPLPCLPVT